MDKDLIHIKQLWKGECYIHGFRTNACGVAILLKDNFEYETLSCEKDMEGNYLCLTLKIGSITVTLLTLYGPSKESPSFFLNIKRSNTET